MLDYLIPVLSALISLYIPFQDVSTKVAFSMALTQIVAKLSEFLTTKFLPRLRTFFGSNDNYVIIGKYDVIYRDIIDYLNANHTTGIKGCYMVLKPGSEMIYPQELSHIDICEKYKGYKIKFKLEPNSSGGGEPLQNRNYEGDNHPRRGVTLPPDVKDIRVYSKAPLSVIQSFILELRKKIRIKSDASKELKVYKIFISGRTDDEYIEWISSTYYTNKSIETTIVSDNVKKALFDDIDFFINNEAHYSKHGMPYKRGYLLYGEPGTGKTSTIKALAVLYGIPIFTVDCNQFMSNDKFVSTMDRISNLVLKQKHIVLFEDIDRSSLFTERDKSITKDCFLNVIDGIDEHYGRIVFLTANDLSVFSKFHALLRYGRIDVQVKVTHCTLKQIKSIFQLFDKSFDEHISPDVVITPSSLLQIIHSTKSIKETVSLLNQKLDFRNHSLESV